MDPKGQIGPNFSRTSLEHAGPFWIERVKTVQDGTKWAHLISELATLKAILALCSFTLPRFQILARRSVQFSSFHFYLAKISYNTRKRIGILSWQMTSEETRRPYETWAPQLQRNKQMK